MRYRRILEPGGTFFFTVVTYKRRKLFVHQEPIDLLLKVTDEIRKRHHFVVVALAILPDHIHAIWELPPDDPDYPTRWRLIKTGFTRLLPAINDPLIPASHKNKNERTIWQRRYWEHTIRDDRVLDYHIDYIHFNPVHHGLVKYPHEWRYSTFLRFVEDGYYPIDWATSDIYKGIRSE